jgi:hypothetical protein
MKWIQTGLGYSNSTGGLTGDLVTFIILSGLQQIPDGKAEVFTEIDMSVTE